MNRTFWAKRLRCSGLHAAAGLLLLVAAGCSERGAGDAKSDRIAGADRRASLGEQPDGADSGQPVVGEPFPYTQFITGDGQVVDLAQATDRKYTMLVFMRGFPGYVCPYCTSQTAELLKRYEEIASTKTELYVVFPGAAETIPKFLEAVREYAKSKEETAPPFPVLLDVDLKAVDALGIRRDLARPSTFILDAAGTLVHSYVGKDPTDRPTLDDLLRVLKTAPDANQAKGG